MRISDWSSDVCSSDLFFHGVGATGGEPAALQVIASAVLAAVAVFTVVGLYKVEPNQAAVLSLFGKYVGTVKDNGLRWSNPFFAKRKVSMRVRNFRSEEHTSELQSLMRISYAVFCLKKKNQHISRHNCYMRQQSTR